MASGREVTLADFINSGFAFEDDGGVDAELLDNDEDTDEEKVEQEEKSSEQNQVPAINSPADPAAEKKPKVLSPFEKLELQLSKETNPWFINLKNFLGVQLQVYLAKEDETEEKPSYTQADVVSALQKLLTGELENFTDNLELAKQLLPIQEALTIQPYDMTYTAMLGKSKSPPTVELFKLATVRELINKAKEEGVDLTCSQEALEKIVLQDHLFYNPLREYSYHQFTFMFSKLIAPYGINTSNTDIFEHTLLNLAGITEFSTFCRFQDRMNPENDYDRNYVKTVGHFSLHLKLTYKSIQKLISFLNKELGAGTAEKMDACYENVTAICINTKNMVKKILSKEFALFLEKYLENKKTLQNYLFQMQKKALPFERIADQLNLVGRQHKVTTESSFLAASLLQEYGIVAKLKSSKFHASERYDAFAACSDLSLEMPFDDASMLATHLLSDFEDKVRLLTDAEATVHQIAFSNELFFDAKFQTKLRSGLNKIATQNIELLEELQVQSHTREKTTSQLSAQLQELASEYKDSDERLTNSLQQFSLFAAARKPAKELDDASFAVTIAVSAHEGACCPTRESLNLFRNKQKVKIELIQQLLDPGKPKEEERKPFENVRRLHVL